MSQNKYKASNPFDDEDEDDFKFGNRGASYSKGPEDELKQLKERIGYVENESLQSTERALRSIIETREIGTKTAEVSFIFVSFYSKSSFFPYLNILAMVNIGVIESSLKRLLISSTFVSIIFK